MPLNNKQKQFCIEYIKDFNATQAYIRAGYAPKNENVAGVEGHKLLRNPKIQDELSVLIETRYAESDMDVKKLLASIVRDATYDIRDILDNQQVKKIDDDGNEYTVDVVALKDWNEIDGTLISEIKQTKDGIQVKLPDRQKAKEQIARHFGMFVDRHEHTGKDGKELTAILKIVPPEKSGSNGNGKDK